MSELEEGRRLTLDFGKLTAVAASGSQVVPVVLQDDDSAGPPAAPATRKLPSGAARPTCFYRAVADSGTLKHLAL